LALEPLEDRNLLAAATVNFNDVHQVIDGFGASTAWSSGTIPQTGLTNAFSITSGAGLTLVRSRIAPNGTTSENSMALQALDNGARVWSTPWAPPREWKTNHDNANGGSLLPAHYQDYANYLADYVQDMAAQGVLLYGVSLQNEPNWVATYESCSWSAAQFAAFLPYVGQTFATRGITTKIMLPEMLNWNFSLADTVMTNPALAQYVGILAAHNYGETATSYQTPYANQNGKPLWETEVTINTTSTAIANALNVADDIHQAMGIASASAYHYWWLNASGDSGLLDGSWNATKRLWAMAQYSRFVRPGWVRVGETDDGGLDITTFKDPASGKFAIVVANTSTTSSVTESFTLNGISASSVTPYITSTTDNVTQYSDISLSGGATFSATIAASSIVTYYGISSASATLQTPTNLTAAPTQGNSASRVSLTWTDNSSSETGYTVERSTDANTWTVLNSALAANTASYSDTGLAENTKYYYRVKANGAGGDSAYATVANATTVLSAASGVSGARSASGVNLTWTINSAVSTGVQVDRSLDGEAWTIVATLSTRATSYNDVIPSYDANQVYYYRVRNTTSANYSTWARWNTSLSVPSAVSASNVKATALTFNWNSPTTGLSGAWIERLNSATNTWTVVSPSALQATDGTWRIGGLAPNTTYTFRMRESGAGDQVYSGYSASITATTSAATIGPIVWYKANETSGATLADASPNAKNAALTGTFSFGAGVNGNAVTLNGGYGQAPNGIVSELGDFTISVWIKPTSVDTWSRVFDFGSGNSDFMFFTPKAGTTNLPRFSINDGSGQQMVDSSVAISANAWTHVAITLSGGAATLYLNGAVVGTNTAVTLKPSSLGTTTQNYLAKSQSSADPTFKGSLDEMRIYERSLSATEIATLATSAANAVPTIVTPAVSSPPTVTGTTATLSVAASDDGGEPNLTYTWSLAGTPPAAVTFSANGTNASKNTVATFAAAGSYAFVVTVSDLNGGYAFSTVTVTVAQTPTGLAAIPSLPLGTSQQMSAVDQFGAAISSATLSWSCTTGAITSTGLFTAPTSGSSVTVTATNGSFSANTTISLASPVAWYKGDETSGTTLGDSSGNNRTATLSGATAFITGKIGNALALTGGYASLPTGIVSSLTNFTISTWVYLDSNPAWARIFDFGSGTNVNMFMTANPGGSSLRFAITTSGGGGGEQQINGTAITLGTWTHIAVTLASGVGTLYINGVAAGTNSSMTLTPTSLGSTTQNYLGKSQYTADAALQGKIDDFRIYGASFSAAAVNDLYTAWQIPTVATNAAASPVVVVAQTTNLNTLGADDSGEANLTYTWVPVSIPSGASPPTLSANGTNSAKNTTATFSRAGSYTFQVRIADTTGYTATSNIGVTVQQTSTALTLSPTNPSITVTGAQQFTASVTDQFGSAIASPTVSWGIIGTGNSISAAGLATAGTTPGSYTVSATSGSAMSNTTLNLTAPSFSIINTNDSGAGSLRQAILDANAGPAVSGTLNVNVSGTIQLTSQLPDLNRAEMLNLAGGNVNVGTANAFTFGQFSLLTLAGGGVLTLGGSQTHTSAAAINVTGGGLILTSDAGASVSLSASAPVTFGSSQHLASLSLTGSTATLSYSGKLLTVSALSLDAAARLDLAGNKMIIHATSGSLASVLTSVTGWLATGYGVGASHWNGLGISSTTAWGDSSHLTAVGMMSNTLGTGQRLSTFGGETVNANDILLRYTYYGDANLDGLVRGADYALTDNGFNFGLSGFGNGDFNYDGAITAADYALIDNAFNFQGGPLGQTALQPLALSLSFAEPPSASFNANDRIQLLQSDAHALAFMALYPGSESTTITDAAAEKRRRTSFNGPLN
jgi:O-glycosyl hydrolase